MRECTKCQIEKPETEFNYKSKASGTRTRICTMCQRAASNAHYAANKASYKKRARVNTATYMERNAQYVANLKLKCTECGEDHPAVLDFHHTDSTTKEFDISAMIFGAFSLERIQQEIDKCITLCSNCHRILHWKERTPH